MAYWWAAVQPDLDALDLVIAGHFVRENPGACLQNINRRVLSEPGGCYSIVYLYTLHDADDKQIDAAVAKLVYPWRPRIKTEGEVAAMRFLRARQLPVARVYQYCAEPNPVRLEWILMEFIHGERADRSFNRLGPAQKQRFINQVANLVATLFSFEATLIGSLLPDKTSSNESYIIGPLADLVFEDPFLPTSIPAEQCGPFTNERDLFQAYAYLGKPGVRPVRNRRPGEKLLELYDAQEAQSSDDQKFHFSHGDLAGRNILVTEEGIITAILDFANSGYRPGALAVAFPDFLDDEADMAMKCAYLLSLREASQPLYQYHLNGVEKRQMYEVLRLSSTPGNIVVWLFAYVESLQSTSKRDLNAKKFAFVHGFNDWLATRGQE